MSNLSLLSKEEYERICFAIPHKYIIGYLQKNPKEFNKLIHGFRPNALPKKDAIRLLINYRDKGFISSFLDKVVYDWIKEIKSVAEKYQNSGESEITSYVHTLYQSFFF